MTDKQIKEDYVSFEVAKLLKEKGFDAKCLTYYASDDEIAALYITRDFNNNGIFLSAPTLQLAMKWLREIHNYIITIDYDSYENADDSGVTIGYSFSLQKKENPSEYKYIHDWAYDTYEEAAEEAIRRTLENIITPIPNS